MTEPPTTTLAVPIGPAAYRARRQRVASCARAAGADLSVWWANHRVSYLTVEPGVYVEGLGGFRHSDTILVAPSGPEFLTDYPRELGDLVLPL